MRLDSSLRHLSSVLPDIALPCAPVLACPSRTCADASEVAAVRVGLYVIPNTKGMTDGVWLIYWVAIEANVALVMVSATAFRGLFGQRAQKRGARRRAQAAPHDYDYYYASDSGAQGSRSRRLTIGNRSRVTAGGSSRASRHPARPSLLQRLAFWRTPAAGTGTGSSSAGPTDAVPRAPGATHPRGPDATASIALEKRWSVHVAPRSPAPALPGAAGSGKDLLGAAGSGKDLLGGGEHDDAAPGTPETGSSTAGSTHRGHGSRTTFFDDEETDVGFAQYALDPRFRVAEGDGVPRAVSTRDEEKVEMPKAAVLK